MRPFWLVWHKFLSLIVVFVLILLVGCSPAAITPSLENETTQIENKEEQEQRTVEVVNFTEQNLTKTNKSANAILIQYYQQKNTLSGAIDSLQQTMKLLRFFSEFQTQREILEKAINSSETYINLTISSQELVETNSETLKAGGYNPDFELQRIIGQREEIMRILENASKQAAALPPVKSAEELLVECKSLCFETSIKDKPELTNWFCPSSCNSALKERGIDGLQKYVIKMENERINMQ